MTERPAKLPTELWRWDALDLAEAIRARTISSREAVAACLTRLAAVNGTVNAVVNIQADQALAAADNADAATKRDGTLPPLHGVPVLLKDLVDQAGIATVDGVAAFKTRIATEDSPVVANWRRAGAIILGRTNTPPFSARWDTSNAVHGRTWNPWTRARTPGGSSGGAGAALATGIAPLAHGTDLGGSIRYPAYCCGVSGIRPTMGRVPQFNSTMAVERTLWAQMIAVHGALARRVRDLRVGLAAMSAGDPRDPFWVPAPLVGPPPARPIKVALVTDSPGLFVHAAVRSAVRKAGAALADAGYLVEEVQPPSISAAAQLWASLGATDTRLLGLDTIRKLGDAESYTVNRLFIETVPPIATMADYLRALAEVMTHRRAWGVFLESYPLIVGPNSGDLPFEIGFDIKDIPLTQHQLSAQALMTAVNLLGLPSVAVPVGSAEVADAPRGLPLGVQVIAGRYREDLALEAAEAIEARHPSATPIDPVT